MQQEGGTDVKVHKEPIRLYSGEELDALPQASTQGYLQTPNVDVATETYLPLDFEDALSELAKILEAKHADAEVQASDDTNAQSTNGKTIFVVHLPLLLF